MFKIWLKKISYIIFIIFNCIASIVFFRLYLDTFTFFTENKLLVYNLIFFIAILLFAILTIVFIELNKKFIYKIFILTFLLIFCVSCCLYYLKLFGVLDKFNSVQALRRYVVKFGLFSSFIFIFLQFLQVVILPVPSFITVGAGVLLFGPFLCSVYSTIGIVLGSLVAFFIGRIFGSKVVAWLIGKEKLDKLLKLIDGKDKFIFTFMFILPFFPDDMLCFVAGLTNMSCKYFVLMIIVCRIITIFCSSYSLNNSLIPYNTWWGLCLWILFFVCIIYISLKIYSAKFKTRKH